jgi:hypothetical protein
MSRWTGRSIVAVTVAVAAFAVLMVVSASGPVSMWHDPPPSPPERPTATVDTIPVYESTPMTGEMGEPPDSDVLRVIVTVVGIVLIVMVLYAVASTFLGRIRVRRRFGPKAQPHAALPEPPPETIEMDVEGQLAALEHGTPRNAIVECWLRLEDDVAAAGLPRQASETSAEFTTRVLASYSLDAGPIVELAALYREARFSRHELGAAERDRALVALRSVHASLGAAAVATTDS